MVDCCAGRISAVRQCSITTTVPDSAVSDNACVTNPRPCRPQVQAGRPAAPLNASQGEIKAGSGGSGKSHFQALPALQLRTGLSLSCWMSEVGGGGTALGT